MNMLLLQGQVILKCLGFQRDDLVQKLFGEPVQLNASFWINGDPNLVANDQFQALVGLL